MSPLTRPPCAHLHDPIDFEGRSIFSGRPLECVGPVTAELVFPELTLLLDFMSSMTGQLVMSHRAAAIIEKFQLQEGWQAIPCKVTTEQGEALRDCVCFHFPKLLDVLDEEKSEFKPMPHKCRGPVVRPVLKRCLVEPFDLCKAVYVHCVCSENLADAIQVEGLEGFVFEELECVD